MSIIIGPFDPTPGSGQFNDQLYLQSGAYVIHNPTSYQLTFKKADSNRFILDPGTVRVVHKIGGNSGNVEWTAALVGPLAILNTPGFTIEILQQDVDAIPDESIVSLSQLATQQPRVISLPVNGFFADSGSSLSFSTVPQTVQVEKLGFANYSPTATQVIPRVYFASFSLYGAAAATALCLLGIQQYQANGTTPSGSLALIWQGIVTTLTVPTILQPRNPLTVTSNGGGTTGGIIFKNGNGVFFALELHVTALTNPSAAPVQLLYTVNFDFDVTGSSLIPSESGGTLEAGLGQTLDQYAGPSW